MQKHILKRKIQKIAWVWELNCIYAYYSNIQCLQGIQKVWKHSLDQWIPTSSVLRPLSRFSKISQTILEIDKSGGIKRLITKANIMNV